MMSKKVILITGASSGLGKTTAERLIREGHTVYGGARRIDRMKSLADLGGHPISLDVTDETSMTTAVEKIIKEAGRIDVLVNNAGFGLYGSVEDTSLEDAKYQFEVNVFGAAKLIQLVLPQMRKQKSGKIINMSSMGGKIYTLLGAWYHATKHALEGFSDALRLELKSFGIDVILIEPGIIETEFADVVVEPLIERSKGGAYESVAKKVADATKTTYRPGNGSSPELIAETISTAINSSRPKTRYLVGKLAKVLVYTRRLLGDRLFDRVILSQIK